ncbi:MAG: acetyltransferase [Coxiella sp. (in: Bacteria)]|nr:MAG: acetyltransferase [Coxiella sp. (in: g-proteobacteria)]
MSDKKSRIIIEGITKSGEKFRPSDWAERMSGKLSTFHRHRIRYSPLLQPSTKDGNKCVLLDPNLKASNPQLYKSILDFAETNHLKICREDDEENAKKDPESNDTA